MDMEPRRKRKRSASHAESIQYNPVAAPGVLNPLSHSPNSLRQFAVAGLPEVFPNPSDEQTDFPHRSLQKPLFTDYGEHALFFRESKDEAKGPSETQEQVGVEDEGSASLANKKATARNTFSVMKQSLWRFLDIGQYDRARKILSVLVRFEGGEGDVVDWRRGRLWLAGSELLVNQRADLTSERTSSASSVEDLSPPSSAAQVKPWLDDVIRRHPFDYRRCNTWSSLDIITLAFSYEIHTAHRIFAIGLRQLEDDFSPRPERPTSLGTNQPYENDIGTLQLTKDHMLRRRKDIGETALRDARIIAGRLDKVLRENHVPQMHTLWSLRGTLALYLADLVTIFHPDTPSPPDHGLPGMKRDSELLVARKAFRGIVQGNGYIDEKLCQRLRVHSRSQGSDDDDGMVPDENQSNGVACHLKGLSALPIRGV